MPLTPTTADAGRIVVGDVWPIGFTITDDVYARLTDATVVVTVTRPDTSSTPATLTRVTTGTYLALYTIGAAGRHTAVVAVSGTVTASALWAVEALTVGALPTAAEAQAYLTSTGATSYALSDISAALVAETAAQGRACRVPAWYPADLREALFRRVARNLAARSVPVAQWSTFEGGASGTRVPTLDPEIRRLEAPHRRMVVG